MLHGIMTADREAIIRFSVRGLNGQEQEIEAVIDAGFNGFLTLPPAIVAALGLPLIGRGRAILANGSEELFSTDSLVGMSMLYGYRLKVDAIDGGAVTIEALP